MAEVCKILITLVLFFSPILGNEQIFDSSFPSSSQEIVPVLLWQSKDFGSVKEDENAALSRLDSEQFEYFLVKKVTSEKPLILLFIEENLSSEDFIMGDSTDSLSFPKLKHLSSTASRSNFFPSVHDPIRAVRSLEKKGYKWVSQSVDTSSLKSTEQPTILALSLNDVSELESRPQLLQRHDTRIDALFRAALSHHKNVLAIYTGRFSSWSPGESHHRVRRLLAAAEAVAAPKDAANGTLIVDDKNSVMLYTTTFPVLNITGGASIKLKKATMTTSDESKDCKQRLIVTFSEEQKVTVRFCFTASASGYWSLADVQVVLQNSTEVVLSTKKITVPFNFSYHSTSVDTMFKNGSVQFILRDYQIQPFLSKARFGDAYDTVYFFTIPILSGIFVTTFLAVIMTWGLCMILDIKTMDRFDDAKGKTISINVSE